VYRRRRHGQSSADRLGEQFVVFTQNHDQIANGCGGKRLSELVSVEQQRIATVFLLCAPNLPLLFMGQEFGATNPFLYFTSFDDPALARAVSEGRKREFAGFFDDFVDPQAPESFARSRLNWAELRSEPHAALLKLYRDLIALRKTHPALSNCRKDLLNVQFDESAKWMCITRGNPAGESSLLLCNFAANAQDVPLPPATRNSQLAIWSEDPHYGGQAGGEEPQRSLTSSTGQVVGQVRLSKWACALYFGNATLERE
jgi:maltooligosyltrehalose trehalohydrolase